MFRTGLLLTLALTIVIPTDAQLQPDEIAILAVQSSRESQALAKYYARVRSIPSDNICVIDMPTEESLPRTVWDASVRPAIRRWLGQGSRRSKIKCLVTVWDVPLKIGRAEDDTGMAARKAFLTVERQRRIDAVEKQVLALTAGVPGYRMVEENPVNSAANKNPSETDTAQGPKTLTDSADTGAAADIARLRQQLESVLGAAQEYGRKLSDRGKQQELSRQLQQLVAESAGLTAIATSFQRNLATVGENVDLKTEFDFQRGRIAAFDEGRRLALSQVQYTIPEDQLQLALLQRTVGALGSAEWIDARLKEIDQNETNASFDSELSLVLWDEYATLRWQPNYLQVQYEGSALQQAFPTLMVSRLEAPTLKLTKALINVAVTVEKTGLEGKAYFDARGLAKPVGERVPVGSYEDYDRALLNAAQRVESLRKLAGVVTNDQTELFQPGECPDAAIYCGWYSLAKYVDAFDWRPGAVAYHLASSEAITIRQPESEVWCKRMLDDGVCATLGPTAEPYLQAFPRPDQFFPLLMQGDLTLVEVYYRTKPFNSWMMTLIGDPLYRPFRKKGE